MEEERIAVYPGSFDPVTNGHLSIIRRALTIFDKVIVAIAVNSDKTPLFTVEERLDMLRVVFSGTDRVEVDSFAGLTVDYVTRKHSKAILRGLRGTSDFEYEFQLATMNRKLNPAVQSIFLMTDHKWFYISSSVIKAAVSLGADVCTMVPDYVYQKLKAKFTKRHLEHAVVR